MHYEIIMTVFTSVFLAELGDKTQIATFLFASDKNFSKMDVFAGACLALILSSASEFLQAASFPDQLIRNTSPIPAEFCLL